MTKLSIRRQRGELIQIFKIINKLDDIELHSKLNFAIDTRNELITRVHDLRIIKETFSSRSINDNCSAINIRKNFLTQKAINNWNNLSNEIIKSGSLNSFKSKLDKWIDNNNLK